MPASRRLLGLIKASFPAKIDADARRIGCTMPVRFAS
jgi:hypothetical protein